MNANSGGGERVLLVQCCYPPQLIFMARKLARLHPDWRLELLAADRPEIRKAVEGAPEFEKIHWLSSDFRPEEISFDRVVYPLLNRGYARIKRRARAIPGTAFEADYEASLRPLEKGRLRVSAFRALHRATLEFAAFHKRFAPDPLGPRILLVHSCRPSLLKSTRKTWQRWFPDNPQITRVAGRVSLRELSLLRRKSFDSAVVFFSGQRGHLALKFLPFLLRVPQILVVNELGACFVARPASLASFAWQRFWHGVRPPQSRVRILMVQTETPRYIAHAVGRLKEKKLYPEAEVILLCREADRREFAGVSGIDGVVAYRGGSWREKWRLLRKLRALDPDFACAVFSGRGVFRPAKILFLLFADRPLLAFNAGLDCYWVTPRSLPRLLRKDTPLYLDPPAGTPVTLVQTEAWQYTLEALRRLRAPSLYPAARVKLYCSAKDRARFEGEPGVERIETFEEAARRGWFKVWLDERRRRPDLTAAIFTGRGVFRKQKLLFFLLSRRHRLVFNARLDAYWLGWRTLHRPLRREPLALEADRPSGLPVTLVQTEVWQYTLEALRRLRGPNLYPAARVTLYCREADRSRFEGEPGLERLETFEEAARRGWLKVFLEARRRRPEVTAAVFSGRGVYRKQKALFWLLSRRNRLVFNARLDAYWLGWRTLSRPFRREPLLFGLDAKTSSEALLIQTESEAVTREALRAMLSGKVLPQKQVAVFCREDLAAGFASLPEVSRVYAYRSGAWKDNWSTLFRMALVDRDVAAAILSGRSVFRLQKLLFFTLPARNRLVFNENLDCFYLPRSRVGRLLHLPSFVPRLRGQSLFSRAFRLIAKGVLFLPRYAYLMLWLTVAKMKRAKRLGDGGALRL